MVNRIKVKYRQWIVVVGWLLAIVVLKYGAEW